MQIGSKTALFTTALRPLTGNGTSGSAVTTWNYNQYRGWLEKKVYAGETDNTLDYEYKPSGRLWKRHWERGVITTYGYHSAGDVETVTYSNDPQSTPALGYTYDRRGRKKTITQGSATTTLTYNDANEVLTESYTGSGTTLNGLTVTRGYDTALRRSSLALNSPQAINHTYGYDTASGRLQTVSDGMHSATYGYLVNSPLVSTVTFKQNTTTRLTTTKVYDFLNRLTSISSSPSAASQAPISHAYVYNNANQRTRNTAADGSYWLYEYDALGQVKSGKKYWSNGTPVAGQQFEYTHDEIGNRTQTKAGGDQNGANLRQANYTSTTLNQYSSRDVPGAVDVMGIAFATATVTVNGQSPYRKGEYFRKELTVANSSAPVWQSVSVAATDQTTVNGNFFVPQTPENFDDPATTTVNESHDADGNQLRDGRWTYTWDAENRLTKVESLACQRAVKTSHQWANQTQPF